MITVLLLIFPSERGTRLGWPAFEKKMIATAHADSAGGPATGISAIIEPAYGVHLKPADARRQGTSWLRAFWMRLSEMGYGVPRVWAK